MKTETLNLAQARAQRDALVLDIIEWLVNAGEYDDWMNGNVEIFLNELCECRGDWLERWREYEQEFADHAPELSHDWLDLRQLIERVQELELERMKR